MSNFVEGWEVLSLKNVFRLGSGETRPQDIRLEQIDEFNVPVYGGNGVIGYSKSFNSNGNVIVIGRVGEYCGVTRYVSDKCWITDNALYTRSFLRKIDRSFLTYSLQYFDLSKLRNKGGQPLVSQKPIYALKFVFPPLPEQRKIAKILSTWDKAIAATEALIAASEEEKRGLMQDLLTGKRRFGGFEGAWRRVRLGEVVKEVKRPVVWDDNDEYKLLSVRRRSGGIFLREVLQGSQIKTKNMSVVLKDDFLISKMQVVHGAMSLVTEKYDGCHVSGSYVILNAREGLDIRFFDWVCKLPSTYHKAYLSSSGVHIEKMTFDLALFLKKSIKLPSLPEQEKIAEVLSAADREIELLREKLAYLQEEKKGLMQVLLTGKRRVVVEMVA